MADSSPSPFRRFPWAQLAFCLACLTMTGWMWMRYSYCRSYAIDDLKQHLGTEWREWPQDTYVQIKGGRAYLFGPIPEWGLTACYLKAAQEDVDRVVSVRGTQPTMEQMRSEGIFRGRLHLSDRRAWGQGQQSGNMLLMEFDLRADASRFHPASIAGIVVGAMGCFIFGLYLRRWILHHRDHGAHGERRS